MSGPTNAPTWFCNGLDAGTGTYLPPVDPQELLHRWLGLEPPRPASVIEGRLTAFDPNHLGPKEGIDPLDLSQSGWGVIFAAADPRLDARRQALAPFLDYRRAQAGPLYREYEFQAEESLYEFRDRVGIDHGLPDPEKAPYYLLIAAEPTLIPWGAQADLDFEYAVGRLALDELGAEKAYTEALMAWESRAEGFHEPLRAAFFAPRCDDDPSTVQSHDFLTQPLAEVFTHAMATHARGWQVDLHLGDAATRATFGELLGTHRPHLLFAASHGLVYAKDDPRQRRRQGALICQEWPGPRRWTSSSLPPEFTFAAEDLPVGLDLSGMVFVHFACFGAGTSCQSFLAQRDLAAAPFVAALPQALLAHGALGVIAHLNEAWAHSYLALEGGDRLESYESLLRILGSGQTLGTALDPFNHREASLAKRLLAERADIFQGGAVPRAKLAKVIAAHEDARNYVLLGDPAARIVQGG